MPERLTPEREAAFREAANQGMPRWSPGDYDEDWFCEALGEIEALRATLEKIGFRISAWITVAEEEGRDDIKKGCESILEWIGAVLPACATCGGSGEVAVAKFGGPGSTSYAPCSDCAPTTEQEDADV